MKFKDWLKQENVMVAAGSYGTQQDPIDNALTRDVYIRRDKYDKKSEFADRLFGYDKLRRKKRRKRR